MQPCVDECLFVRRGEHARISNDGDFIELVGLLESCDHRQHRVGFCRVASKRAHMQWKPSGISKQPDKDLRLEAALFGKPGFAKLIRSIGFEVQGGHVVQDECAWPDTCMMGQRLG